MASRLSGRNQAHAPGSADAPSAPRGHQRRLLATSIGWIFVSGLIVCSLLADELWPAELPLHFAPQMAVVLLATTVLSAVLARRVIGQAKRLTLAGAMLTGVAGGWLIAQAAGVTPDQLRLRPKPLGDSATASPTLRVMVMNVYGPNRDFDRAIATIRARRPDVIGFAEVNRAWAEGLTELHDEYPHRLIPVDRIDIALFSRHPLESVELNTYEQAAGSIEATMSWPPTRSSDAGRSGEPGQAIRLLLMHPPPPIRPRLAARHRASWNVEGTRLRQLRERGEELPTIVFGDMNCTAFATTLQRFCREARLFDSGQGQGVWMTWPFAWSLPVWPLGIRIDHVLISSHWGVREYHQPVYFGSDHLAAIVDVQLAE